MSDWKETELGLIPNEWEIQNSSIYCTKITDGTHDSPKQVFSGYPLITSKHIKGNSIDFEEAYLISQEDYEAIVKRSKVDQYDLIISMIGEYCGFTYLETSQQVNYATKNVGLFKNKSKTHALWLKYYLDSPIGKHQLRLRRSGTSQPYISLGSLRSLPILNPKSDITRQSIVNILSCLDAKIENLRRQNETLEQIAQTLFKHWFIDFEFPNADGKPYKSSGGAMVASELGDIPEGWKVGKLGNEFEILMGQSPSGSSFNEDKQGMIFFQGRTDFGFRFPTIRLYTTEPSRIAEKFDVLVSVRAPVGDVNLASDKCCIGRGLAAVKSQYKSYCLHKIKSFKKLFNLFESEGTVFGSINKQSFNSLESIIPTDKVIKDFEALVKTIDQKFYVNDLQIQTLTKTRDSLLPKLMSGQLRVKE